jgi:hypothetical protein
MAGGRVTVCYGVIADSIGGAGRYSLGPPRLGTGVPELHRHVDIFGSDAYELRQRAVRVDVEHDAAQPLGRLAYLENAGGKLWAVTELRERLPDDGDWYWSPRIYYRDDGRAASHIRLDALTLTKRPGSVGLGAVRSLSVRLDSLSASVLCRLPLGDAGLLRRAAAAQPEQRDSDTLSIHGMHQPDSEQRARERDLIERPTGVVRHSPPLPGSVLSVR